ncbi:chemotaxis protein CheW [bacterium]|nr:chemotaxis protein CheW [bacterium]
MEESVSLGGKYLTFLLSREQYGIEILKVVEIFGMMKVTAVPRSPDYMKGVINLRGKIIPVMDLRLRFGLEERDYDDKTCIIVVSAELEERQLTVGIIVDTVLEVKDFQEDLISASPDYGAEFNTDFILGIGRGEHEEVTILLDLVQILPQDQVVLEVTESEAVSEQ